MLKNKGAIVNTLKSAWQMYRVTLKSCFLLAIISAAIAEYFKLYALNSGVSKAVHSYMQTGELPNGFPDAQFLAFLGLFSMFVTMCVYGLLICVGGNYLKEGMAQKNAIQKAFSIFKKRFPSFLMVCILNGFLWFLASFLNIFGLWLAASFTLILLPTVLLGNVGVWMSFRENFRLLTGNLLYALQLGFIVMLVLLLKYVIYALFMAIGQAGNVNFGVEHVVIIFVDALTLPFIIMIMVAAFYELNARDDMPI
ncbi:hypothetical protein [Cysteiniphilum halobium]|uniref:hypothetical protein n=1 Tax=Cysteiniphilum halobium TaxID=2219059 RepID=UPI003F865970